MLFGACRLERQSQPRNCWIIKHHWTLLTVFWFWSLINLIWILSEDWLIIESSKSNLRSWLHVHVHMDVSCGEIIAYIIHPKMRSHPATTLEVSHHSIFWRTGLVTVNNQAKPTAGENFLQTALFRPVSSNLKSHQREISGGECSPPIFGLFQKPGGNSKFLGGIPPFPPAYWTLYTIDSIGVSGLHRKPTDTDAYQCYYFYYFHYLRV